MIVYKHCIKHALAIHSFTATPSIDKMYFSDISTIINKNALRYAMTRALPHVWSISGAFRARPVTLFDTGRCASAYSRRRRGPIAKATLDIGHGLTAIKHVSPLLHFIAALLNMYKSKPTLPDCYSYSD